MVLKFNKLLKSSLYQKLGYLASSIIATTKRNTVIIKACHSIEVPTSTWTCIKHLNTVLTSERLGDGKTKVVVEGYGDQVEEAEDKQTGTVENLVQSV